MEEKKKDKKHWLLIIIFLILGSLLFITVSYTIGSTLLKIVGFNTTQVVSWDVRIKNVSTSTIGKAKVKNGKVSDTVVKGFDVSFFAPDDAFTMTFDIVNRGTMNAKLDYFKINRLKCTHDDGTDATDYCNDIYYVVEYADGKKIKLGDVLRAGQKRRVKLTLKYHPDSLLLNNELIHIDDIGVSFIFGQK